jgi:hypothetical protein
VDFFEAGYRHHPYKKRNETVAQPRDAILGAHGRGVHGPEMQTCNKRRNVWLGGIVWGSPAS